MYFGCRGSEKGEIVMIGTLLLAKFIMAHIVHTAVATHVVHGAVATHVVHTAVTTHVVHTAVAAHTAHTAHTAGAAHVALAAGAASLTLPALGIPIFTGAVGNLASDSIKQHLVKNTSNTVEQAFENEEEAKRIFLEAVAVATKAFREYHKTESKEALDRYVEASARAQLANNFINPNNGSQVSIG